ncbi:MAG: hypothetical protein U9N33_06365, partial [Campylobacterota bacterium]|nr:hypothetical protein [Campylobacterota bacterium]
MQKKIDLDSFIHTPDASNEILNYKQRAYLKEKKRVTVCIDPNWMPYEKFDENREHVGMSADYFKLF